MLITSEMGLYCYVGKFSTVITFPENPLIFSDHDYIAVIHSYI